jgi:hypothetical protein
MVYGIAKNFIIATGEWTHLWKFLRDYRERHAQAA